MDTAPTRSRQRLCIVCPCYREGEGIAAFHERLTAVLDEHLPELERRIVLVDDGSPDDTLAQLDALAARDPDVRVVALSRNFGHQAALSAGIDAADGDAVVLMDSDLQHPPELVPELVAKWREGYDVVSAVRRRTADATFYKRLTSWSFYGVFNLLSETKLVPGAADFVLMSRSAHEALRTMPEYHRFLRGMVSWVGFPRAAVEYEAAPRHAGVSSYSTRKMLSLALTSVTSFSGRPLRLAMGLGLTMVAVGTAYLVYVLVMALAVRETETGWPSLISTVLIVGGRADADDRRAGGVSDAGLRGGQAAAQLHREAERFSRR